MSVDIVIKIMTIIAIFHVHIDKKKSSIYNFVVNLQQNTQTAKYAKCQKILL